MQVVLALALISLLLVPTTLLQITADDGPLLYSEPGFELAPERIPLYLSFNASSNFSMQQPISQVSMILYEKDLQTKVSAVACIIIVTDLSDNATIIRDVFYSEHGTFKLDLLYSDDEEATRIIGIQEPFLNAWVADDNLSITSPMIVNNATYGITIEILTVDDIQNFIAPENVPRIGLMLDTGKNVTSLLTAVSPLDLSYGNSFSLTTPALLDLNGSKLEYVELGQQATIQITFQNNLEVVEVDQPFAAIVEVRDGKGVTMYLGWHTGSLAAGQSYTLGTSWTPTEPCGEYASGCESNYQIRSFLITDLQNPQVLSAVQILDGVAVIETAEDYNSRLYFLDLDGKEYVIEYSMDSGFIKSVTYNDEFSQLTFQLEGVIANDTEIRIELPKPVVASLQSFCGLMPEPSPELIAFVDRIPSNIELIRMDPDSVTWKLGVKTGSELVELVVACPL